MECPVCREVLEASEESELAPARTICSHLLCVKCANILFIQAVAARGGGKSVVKNVRCPFCKELKVPVNPVTVNFGVLAVMQKNQQEDNTKAKQQQQNNNQDQQDSTKLPKKQPQQQATQKDVPERVESSSLSYKGPSVTKQQPQQQATQNFSIHSTTTTAKNIRSTTTDNDSIIHIQPATLPTTIRDVSVPAQPQQQPEMHLVPAQQQQQERHESITTTTTTTTTTPRASLDEIEHSINYKVLYEETFKAHQSRTDALISFSSGGNNGKKKRNYIISGSRDKNVRLFEVKKSNKKAKNNNNTENNETTKLIPLRVMQGHKGWVTSLAFYEKRVVCCVESSEKITPCVASASQDETIRCWNLKNGELMHTLNLKCPAWSLATYQTTKNEKTILLLLCGLENGMIGLWNMTGTTPMILQWVKNNQGLSPLDVSSLVVWDIVTFEYQKHAYFVSASKARTATNNNKRKINADDSSSSSIIVSSKGNASIHLWDLDIIENDKEKSSGVVNVKQISSHASHSDYAICLCVFQHNKETFVASGGGSKGKDICLWRMTKQNLNLLYTLRGHDNAVCSIDVFQTTGSEEGEGEEQKEQKTILISASHDKQIRTWDFSKRTFLRNIKSFKHRISAIKQFQNNNKENGKSILVTTNWAGEITLLEEI